jgi:hypothetical protein
MSAGKPSPEKKLCPVPTNPETESSGDPLARARFWTLLSWCLTAILVLAVILDASVRSPLAPARSLIQTLPLSDLPWVPSGHPARHPQVHRRGVDLRFVPGTVPGGMEPSLWILPDEPGDHVP